MVTSDMLYVGCYTGESPAGIHVFDVTDGAFTKVGEVIGIENPSFLAAHPNGATVYAVSETSNGRGDGGSLFALAVDPDDGSLTPTQKVASRGDAPCHLSVTADGAHLYVANYGSGSVASFALGPDGSIGPLA
ncbi:MAG: beta-propeller fold lactonase family protein, partial [Acidimicrobiales bacterium]|nr:beta-propeller fold lactonase family protein [Acidimicrobiales bacterium]